MNFGITEKVEKARRGDETALKDLIFHYMGYVPNFLRKNNLPCTEDIFQEFSLKIIETITAYLGEDINYHLGIYIFHQFNAVFLKYLRNTYLKKENIFDEINFENDYTAPMIFSVDFPVLINSSCAHIGSQKINLLNQVVFQEYYLAGKKEREIAGKMNVTTEAVSQRVKKTRKRLKQELDKYYQEN